jgi:integrase
MADKSLQAKVVVFPQKRKRAERARKAGLNRSREGAARKINGKAFVDFMYLGERVRECSELGWNEKNTKLVREQLDKIIITIKSGTFRFAEVFPQSKNRDHFTAKEQAAYRLREAPEDVVCRDYFGIWYGLVKNSGRVTERTLLGYKSYLNLYLLPFLGDLTFGDLSATSFERFIAWARQQHYRGKPIQSKTINKSFTVLKMVCRVAAISYRWESAFSPFFGFKKLPENDAYEDIFPLSLREQRQLIDHLPDHWKRKGPSTSSSRDTPSSVLLREH